jgi:hypothetical protein
MRIAGSRRGRGGSFRSAEAKFAASRPRSATAPAANLVKKATRFAQVIAAAARSPSPRSGEGGRRPDGVRKAGVLRRRFALTFVQSDLGRSSGPHPIRRCAPPLPQQAGEGVGRPRPEICACRRAELGKVSTGRFEACVYRSATPAAQRIPSCGRSSRFALGCPDGPPFTRPRPSPASGAGIRRRRGSARACARAGAR